MARTVLTSSAYNQMPATGLDLAGATFDTLVLGSGNGVEVTYQTNGFLVLSEGGAGAATFTIVTVQPTNYTNLGLAIPDGSYSVGVGEMLLVPFNAAFKQTTGKVFIDCDVAADVAVVTL